MLVNNAGYSILGAVEELSDAETLAMFDTNVFGVHRMIRAVLPPHMRRKNSGRILNIGSVGGFAAVASSGLYGATKFAVEAITEALDLELKGTGVSATVIEPGAFRTDFLSPRSVRFANVVIDDYAATAGAARQAFFKLRRRSTGGRSSQGRGGDPHDSRCRTSPPAARATWRGLHRAGGAQTARRQRRDGGRWRALAESTDFSDVLINE